MTIHFGTDGWRAIIADEFTFDRVKAVAQAIASFLQDRGETRPVIVGYDCRFLAEEFASRAAEVLAGNGFAVRLTDRPTPTPVVAFAVQKTDAAGAVMITASHNPPAYGGIKFIPAYGGPASRDITSAIEAKLETPAAPAVMTQSEAEARGLWREFDPKEEYFRHLEQLVRLKPAKKLKLVVDALYGAAAGYADDFLAEMGFQVLLLHGERDPLFGGRAPDPTPENLGALAETVRREGADLGLALDGDGDRFGVVDAEGNFWSPNQVLPLLLYHLIQSRNWQEGEVARTVATTHTLDDLARLFGLILVETPVGFKFLGERLLAGARFAGEESGGLGLTGHVPEKDGVLAACLVAEMVATRGSLTACQRQLAQMVPIRESRRWDYWLKPAHLERLAERLDNFFPEEVAGLAVTQRADRDGVKLLLEGGSWVLARLSGTEPVLRIYAESPDVGRAEEIGRETARLLHLTSP